VPADYAHILRVIQDRPDAHMIQTMLLRSMSQAVYDPDNRGHFGLAYEAYAHFTSPIRRYPDLLVHRAIKAIINGRKAKPEEFQQLVKAGEHCSMTERRADDATNEVTDWLKCEFMMDKVGKEFNGIISGVTNFGVFVELVDVYVEGLVHISNLPDDYYQFDPIKHSLQGERSGKHFRLGDPIVIQVARVDLDQREIDFVIPANGTTKSAPRTGGRVRPKARKENTNADKRAPKKKKKHKR
jgi:ribonuclease R